MTHINAIRRNPTLEEQLDEIIKNADKEEDKEMFKALKTLANYYRPSQISMSIDHYADGRYDLTIGLNGCRRRRDLTIGFNGGKTNANSSL